MKKDYFHICIVLDASGSMEYIENDIKGSVTAFMKDLKKEEGQTVLDVFQFSNDVQRIVEHANAADHAENLMDSYCCSGTTALHDAVCTAIDTLGKEFAALAEEERPEHVIVAIVTDGHENASCNFTLEDVNTRIKHQTDCYNWEFVYLAAKQEQFEAERISKSMGIQFCESTMNIAELAGSTRKTLCKTIKRVKAKNVSNQ